MPFSSLPLGEDGFFCNLLQKRRRDSFMAGDRKGRPYDIALNIGAIR